jgi:site-specific recombinase XerD
VALYQLRHTYLTNLARAGVQPRVMQKLAEHASVSTTLSIYAHVNTDDISNAVESLSSMYRSDVI